ncbi:hypothetical protein PV327_008319 [Microctonus hyperodae]|uniref:Apyrase n=1 Tax=Microctonus hyperodae TaxID=165561 RepID=A0AA39KH81_MICHY|nr:hypothetical protein PV327_008319 [Microctonus hyperodae]
MQRRAKKIGETMFRDWRQALHTPHIYRVVGNRTTSRIPNQFFILFIIAIIFMLFMLFYARLPLMLNNNSLDTSRENEIVAQCIGHKYNTVYPITAPIKTASGITFKIAIISDLDLESKSNNEKNTWISIFKKGQLLWLPQSNHISISWSPDEIHLSSTLAMKGRGMELSELVTFDGNLTSFDDRTGLIYHIDHDKAYPWIILMDGNGKNQKGFKSEWATMKNQQLYIGSMGKEWTTASGEFIHNNPMWIKILSPCGHVQSVDWTGNFKKLRQAINIEFPGYMIHESGAWSDIHNRWFFLPRRCSQDQYNETRDETMSCNVLLIADENFNSIKVTLIDNPIKIRGFASFKFLPGSQDTIIVALKTEEYQGQTATYITAFTIDGRILLPDRKISQKKFEGLDFI